MATTKDEPSPGNGSGQMAGTAEADRLRDAVEADAQRRKAEAGASNLADFKAVLSPGHMAGTKDEPSLDGKTRDKLAASVGLSTTTYGGAGWPRTGRTGSVRITA